VAFILVFHVIQRTVGMIHSHDMIFANWYPFDATVSPAYELANLSQVMLKLNLLPFENHKDIRTNEYSSQMQSKLIWINNYLSEILCRYLMFHTRNPVLNFTLTTNKFHDIKIISPTITLSQ
jgi:hypothetical protein